MHRSSIRLSGVVLALAVVGGATLSPTEGKASVYQFGFAGDTHYSSLGATISGLIFGLSDNGVGQTPSYAEVLSDSQGAVDIKIPYDVGSFDVKSGKITGANSVDFVNSNYDLSFNVPNGNGASFNALIDASGNVVLNFDGFAGASYSRLSPVPLPASAPMFGAALLALGAIGYGVKRKGKAAA